MEKERNNGEGKKYKPIKLKSEVADRLERIANETGMKKSWLIESLLDGYIKEKRKRNSNFSYGDDFW